MMPQFGSIQVFGRIMLAQIFLYQKPVIVTESDQYTSQAGGGKVLLPAAVPAEPAKRTEVKINFGGLAGVSSAEVVTKGMDAIPEIKAQAEARRAEMRKDFDSRISAVMDDLKGQKELQPYITGKTFENTMTQVLGARIVPVVTAIRGFLLGTPEAFAAALGTANVAVLTTVRASLGL